MTDSFEGAFDDRGNIVVLAAEAARLRELLGHEPRPGERVRLCLAALDPVERWLRTEVAASVDDIRDRPGGTIAVDELRAQLRRS